MHLDTRWLCADWDVERRLKLLDLVATSIRG